MQTDKMYPEMPYELFEAITKETIDSLRICSVPFPDCKKCIYCAEDKSMCSTRLIGDAFNIIQRQQVEIENLRGGNNERK